MAAFRVVFYLILLSVIAARERLHALFRGA
jgi:hypothetical protein